MKFTRSIQWFVISVISVVIMTGMAVFLYFYMQQQGIELQQTLQTIADQEALKAEQTALDALLAKSAADRSEISTYLLSGNDGVVEFLSLIDQVAKQLQLELTTSALSVTPEANGFGTLQIDLSVTGGEAEVRYFLRLLETLPYASEVIRTALTRAAGTAAGSPVMDGEFSLAVTIMNYDQ